MSQARGVIFDIQRFAVHDGPGIRTTVFMKGCSNSCAWCHNPESLSIKPQLEFFSTRCISCGKCFKECPEGAHKGDAGRHLIDHSRCTGCGRCAGVCFSKALVISGLEVPADYVVEQLMLDAAYYKNSGGGATLSGGEPVLQKEFSLEILRQLNEKGIHTVIQTAGNYNFELLEPLLPYINIVMYDLKGFGEEIYRNYIRGSRERIMENLEKLDKFGVPVIVRTPVVGTVNDMDEEILSIARYISNLKNLLHYTLIPYHGLGRAKYEALGAPYTNGFYTPKRDRMKQLEVLASDYVKVFDYDIGLIEKNDTGRDLK